MAADVVVEIREHVQSVGGSCGEPVRPVVETVVRVPAAVFPGPDVKPHVDERTDRERARGRTVHVVEAERHPVAPHQLVDPLVVPARVAELDRMLVPGAAGRECEPSGRAAGQWRFP